MNQSKRNRYLRGPRRRRRRAARSSLLVLLIFVVGIVATVVYVWEKVRVVQQQVVISHLRDQIQKLESDNEYLRMDMLRLSETNHLESLAKSYGFNSPSPHQIIRLPQ